MKRPLTIGVADFGYVGRRIIIDKARDARYTSVKWNNAYTVRNLALQALMRLGIIHHSPALAHRLYFEYRPLLPGRCDIYHFCTTTTRARSARWVVSLEMCVPFSGTVTDVIDSREPDFTRLRDDATVRRVLAECARDNCLGLIAFTECGRRIQLEIARQFPDLYDAIERKTVVLAPPQPLLIDDIGQKGLTYADDEPLTFLFVGAEMYRKGGAEAVVALSELRKVRQDFRLVLIGSPTREGELAERFYATRPAEVQALIKASPWIEQHDSLPKEQYLALTRQSHVALLPTWSDSYGFSSLECQAMGTPVISTAQRGQIEANGADHGWLIDVPVNRLGLTYGMPSRDEKLHFREVLRRGIYDRCAYVLDHRQEVRAKAERCLSYIRDEHSVEAYTEAMTSIYNGSLLYDRP